MSHVRLNSVSFYVNYIIMITLLSTACSYTIYLLVLVPDPIPTLVQISFSLGPRPKTRSFQYCAWKYNMHTSGEGDETTCFPATLYIDFYYIRSKAIKLITARFPLLEHLVLRTRHYVTLHH